MMEWKKVKLGDVATLSTGFPFAGDKYAKEGMRVLRGENIGDKILKWDERSDKRWREPFDKALEYTLQCGDIVLQMDGNVGRNKVQLRNNDLPMYIAQRVGCIRAKENTCQDFLYYVIIADRFCKYLESVKTGTTISHISLKQIGDFEFSLPPLPTQRRIAAILSSLDAQIENNNRINANLEAQAQALFKSWFVDFEPWGGVMPEGWKEGNIYDVADIYDKYRKPLSGNQRDAMKKIYPYYGATSVMDYVDNYIFDGIYTLLGEDGSVVKEDGTPYVQYIWGKVWVNNHAHVLQGKNGYSTEMLHVLFSQLNIKSLVTGAVQAKLNQGNMKNIIVLIPTEPVLKTFRECINSLYAQIRNNTEANTRLASLRDTLLPKLMKGEIG